MFIDRERETKRCHSHLLIFHSTTAAYTTPPLNLAVLNLRYNLRDVITKSLLFIEAQRSGALPDSNRIPWRSHSALSDGSDRGLDLSGGYYIGEKNRENRVQTFTIFKF